MGIAIVLGVVLGCCGWCRDSGPDVPDRDEAVVHPRWHSCAVEYTPDAPDRDAFARSAALLPDTSFEPVTGIVCARAEQRRADGGIDLVETESRVDDLDGLLRVLRLPDEAPEPGTGCAELAPDPEWIVLVDRDGRWLRPGLPAGPCWGPRDEVYDVLPSLRRTVTHSRVIRELVSAGAAGTGCAQRAPNSLNRESLPPGTTEPPPAERTTVDNPADVCVYQQDTVGPFGTFTAGVRLPPPHLKELHRLVGAAGPAAGCADRATRFAILTRHTEAPPATTFEQARSPATFELDGCMRFSTGIGDLKQGDRTLVALLTGG